MTTNYDLTLTCLCMLQQEQSMTGSLMNHERHWRPKTSTTGGQCTVSNQGEETGSLMVACPLSKMMRKPKKDFLGDGHQLASETIWQAADKTAFPKGHVEGRFSLA